MKDSLKLTFLTGLGQKANVNINNPYLNVTEAEVQEAMERIINSLAMEIKNSQPARIYGAQLVQVTEKKFSV